MGRSEEKPFQIGLQRSNNETSHRLLLRKQNLVFTILSEEYDAIVRLENISKKNQEIWFDGNTGQENRHPEFNSNRKLQVL